MVEVYDHIDEIARQKKRHVAGVFFNVREEMDFDAELKRIEAQRLSIIEWLHEREIKWLPCFDFFNGDLDPFYKGDLYVDLVIDPNEAMFSELTELLEDEHENPRLEGVQFKFYRYEDAVENEPFYRESLENI